MKKLIVLLIRKRLGLKAYEKFRFVNQKTDDFYYFGSRELVKMNHGDNSPSLSGVSLNWLLSDECKITKNV